MRTRSSIAVAIAALAIASSAALPSGAAPGAMTCQIAATVTLDQFENLANVDGGQGNLSANFACEGVVSGVAQNQSGFFSFCAHSSSGHSLKCRPTATAPLETSPPDQPSMEPVADTVGNGSPVVAHVRGNLGFTLNTGATCTFSLNGHTVGVQVHIDLLNFGCGASSALPSAIAFADANAQIIVDPLANCPAGGNGEKVCFKQLTFAGHLTAYSAS